MVPERADGGASEDGVGDWQQWFTCSWLFLLPFSSFTVIKIQFLFFIFKTKKCHVVDFYWCKGMCLSRHNGTEAPPLTDNGTHNTPRLPTPH